MTRVEEQKQKLKTAQALAREGRVDDAVRLLVEAEAPQEAVKLLAKERRFSDAVAIVLRHFGLPPETRRFSATWITDLDDYSRKLLMLAAVCMQRAGEPQAAVDLLLDLGELQRAEKMREQMKRETPPPVQAVGAAPAATVAGPDTRNLQLASLVGQGKLSEAADIALELRDFGQAAALFAEAGDSMSSAAAWLRAGRPNEALQAYLDVDRDHPQWPEAAEAIRQLACSTNTLDQRIDAVLREFVKPPITSDERARALTDCASLYVRHELPVFADRLIKKVLDYRPTSATAQRLQAQLVAKPTGQSQRIEHIVNEEIAFREASASRPARGRLVANRSLPGLPDLPDLPGTQMLRKMRGEAASDGNQSTQDTSRTTGEMSDASVTVANRSGSHTLPDTPLVLEPGEVIAGRYKLQKQIGAGGMAVVFAAQDLELEEVVALKIFTQPVNDEIMLKRFKQELLLSRKLQHPNILRLYDIGAVQGRRFISMELLKGNDLADCLVNPPALDICMDWLAQASSALHAAHEKQVVHRDVKPHNIFVCQDGLVKVMDFGIAKSASTNLTTDRMIAGTPDYMSPEQINGFNTVGPSTDIYALGVTAFELSCGQLPFRHEETVPLLLLHVNEPPPRPRDIKPDLPEELETLILQMLEKSPTKRPADCKEVGERFAWIRDLLRASN